MSNAPMEIDWARKRFQGSNQLGPHRKKSSENTTDLEVAIFQGLERENHLKGRGKWSRLAKSFR